MGQMLSNEPLGLFTYEIPIPTFNANEYNKVKLDLKSLKLLRMYYDEDINDQFRFEDIQYKEFHEQLKQGYGSYYGRQMKNDRREGLGIQVYEKDQNGITHLMGRFENDKLNGRGLAIYTDDSYYFGEWKNNECHGFGYFNNANGDFYLGDWDQGKFKEGYFRTATYEYYGQLNDEGFLHGYGRCYYFDGSIVEGEWKNEQLDGFIVHQFQNGDFYYGHSKGSLKQGLGLFNQKKLNKIYIGEFHMDVFHGIGSLIDQEGSQHKTIYGQFKYGKPYGIYNEIDLVANNQQQEEVRWFKQEEAEEAVAPDQNIQDQNQNKKVSKQLLITKGQMIQGYLLNKPEQQSLIETQYKQIEDTKKQITDKINDIMQRCAERKIMFDTYQQRLSKLPCLHKMMEWYYQREPENRPKNEAFIKSWNQFIDDRAAKPPQ